MRRPCLPQRPGFTLIEVMIAASILAAMGGIVFGMFQNAWRQKEDVEYVDNRYAQLRSAMDRMALEISEAYISEHFDRTRFRDRPTLFRGASDKLVFTALANERLEADAKQSDEALLTYSVDHDSGNGDYQDLFRRSNPIVNDDEADHHGRRQVLCEDVKAVKFEYWNTTRIDWDDEWDASRAEHMGVLPERVRITLTFTDENGNTRKMSTQTKILMQRSLAF